MGISKDSNKFRDLSNLSGTWNKEEVKEFEENIKLFNKLDDEIWQT